MSLMTESVKLTWRGTPEITLNTVSMHIVVSDAESTVPRVFRARNQSWGGVESFDKVLSARVHYMSCVVTPSIESPRTTTSLHNRVKGASRFNLWLLQADRTIELYSADDVKTLKCEEARLTEFTEHSPETVFLASVGPDQSWFLLWQQVRLSLMQRW